jgi:hypothetical protein
MSTADSLPNASVMKSWTSISSGDDGCRDADRGAGSSGAPGCAVDHEDGSS